MDLGFIDKILNDVIAYPITVFGFLFFPEQIIGVNADLPLSRPGVTLILSLAILFYSSRVNLILEYAPKLKLPKSVDREDIIYATLFGLLVIIFQWLIITLLFDLEAELPRVIGILTYTISVPFALKGLIFLIFIAFPIPRTLFGFTLLELWDREAKEVREKFPKILTPADMARENASGASNMVAVAVYIIVSVNIIRTVFYPSGDVFDVAKVTIAFVISGVVVFFTLALLTVRFQDKLNELLAQKEKGNQTKKNKD